MQSIKQSAGLERRVAFTPRPNATRISVKTMAFFTKAKKATSTPNKNTPPSLAEEQQGPKVAIGFTASNELFVGRMAMLGVASSIIGELLTGQGALHQLGYEFHENMFEVEFEILAVIAFNVIAALLPVKGRFMPDEDLKKRPDGVLQDPSITVFSDWRRFFGVKRIGFTKENELFVGRVAQLGFAASLIGEVLTGKGLLEQFDCEVGLTLNQTEPLILAFIAFMIFAAINEGSGRFIDEEDE